VARRPINAYSLPTLCWWNNNSKVKCKLNRSYKLKPVEGIFVIISSTIVRVHTFWACATTRKFDMYFTKPTPNRLFYNKVCHIFHKTHTKSFSFTEKFVTYLTRVMCRVGLGRKSDRTNLGRRSWSTPSIPTQRKHLLVSKTLKLLTLDKLSDLAGGSWWLVRCFGWWCEIIVVLQHSVQNECSVNVMSKADPARKVRGGDFSNIS